MRLFGTEYALPGSLSLVARRSVEAALLLLTGILLAKFAWLALAPDVSSASGIKRQQVVMMTDPQNQRLALLTSKDPLVSTNMPATPDAAVPTSLDLKLVGLRWSENEEEASSATILLPGGLQKRFTPGQQVTNGAKLESIASDRIFLRVGGRIEELRLLPRGNSAAPAAASPPSPSAQRQAPQQETSAPSKTVSPALLISDVSFQPETRNGVVTGYQLSPLGNGHFQSAGLEAGDVVIRINGTSVEGLGPDALHAAAISSETLALDVVRKGAIVRLRISPETGLLQ